MSRTIELSDELYEDLTRVAQEHGLTVAGWIASNVPNTSGSIEERPLSELLEGLVATVDSAKEPGHSDARSPFSDLVAKKFEKQGLRRP